jgi:hypothetical protein
VSDVFGIVANVQEGTDSVRSGALGWVCRNPQDGNVLLRVCSRGGRWIETYFAVWKLTNFRAKWLPPAPPTVRFRSEEEYSSRAGAEEAARLLDAAARRERARRNMCEIERMAGRMDTHGKRA